MTEAMREAQADPTDRSDHEGSYGSVARAGRLILAVPVAAILALILVMVGWVVAGMILAVLPSAAWVGLNDTLQGWYQGVPLVWSVVGFLVEGPWSPAQPAFGFPPSAAVRAGAELRALLAITLALPVIAGAVAVIVHQALRPPAR